MAAVDIKKCLIIGYGNSIRCDDGLGPKVVELLKCEQTLVRNNISMIVLSQLDIIMVNSLIEYDLVIFIDARDDDDEIPVRVELIEPSDEKSELPRDTHALSIESLLHLSEHLYQLSPKCYAVLPKGYDFSFSEKLSSKAEINSFDAKKIVMEILKTEDV